MLFFNAGAQYAFGVMFKPIIREFGWSRSAVSLVFLLNMVIFAIALTVVGRLYDRFGPKWIIIISTLFISAGFILTSFIHSLGQFFFSYGDIGSPGSRGDGCSPRIDAREQVVRQRPGAGDQPFSCREFRRGLLLVRLLSLFAVSYGWRTSYLYLGIVMLVVNILLAIFVIKGDPHHLGHAAGGAGDSDEGEAA